MSLSTQDLTSIRGVVLDVLNLDMIRGVVIEALEYIVQPQLDRLEAELKEVRKIVDEHTIILGEHSHILGEHAGQLTGLSLQLNILDKKVDDIDGRLMAIENDVKEIYELQYKFIPPYISDKSFKKLTNPQKIMTLHKALQHIAKANDPELLAYKQ